jgi:phage regulator Rha-like protein
MKEIAILDRTIKNKIFTIRNVQVMLDSDLAELYGVSTKRLNEQVIRNLERFPENFRFQLTKEECNHLNLQPKIITDYENVIPRERILRSQIATLNNNRGKHRKYIPYVFTEEGVAMLSGVLKSETAVNVSIQIINTFVAMRKIISKNLELFNRLDSIEQKHL